MKKAVKKRPVLESWQDPTCSPYVVLENLSKEYDGVPILKGMGLEIYKGEFFCLLGPSGSGKTTLLRLLAGFEMPTDGVIMLGGKEMTNVPAYERPVNMMFQSYALFPHMTVAENVAFGLKQEGVAKNEQVKRVQSVLKLVQMDTMSARMPHQLSGGQCQRVALARCIVKRPKLLLLDEPLAALDKKLRETTQFELVNIQEKTGITFVMVTHDQEEAMTMATRIAVLEEGVVRQVGTPHEIYEYPNSRYVASFIGSMNVFDGVVLEDEGAQTVIQSDQMAISLCVQPAGGAPQGASVAIALRPEKIKILRRKPTAKYNWAAGAVEDIAYLGDVSIYYIKIDDTGVFVEAMIPNIERLSEGEITWDDHVYVTWGRDSMVVLTA